MTSLTSAENYDESLTLQGENGNDDDDAFSSDRMSDDDENPQEQRRRRHLVDKREYKRITHTPTTRTSDWCYGRWVCWIVWSILVLAFVVLLTTMAASLLRRRNPSCNTTVAAGGSEGENEGENSVAIAPLDEGQQYVGGEPAKIVTIPSANLLYQSVVESKGLSSDTLEIEDDGSITTSSDETKMEMKILDLRVLQTQGHFELICLSCANQWEPYNISVRIQGTTQETTWDQVQPIIDDESHSSGGDQQHDDQEDSAVSTETRTFRNHLPHIQTSSAYLVLRSGIEISSQATWVLSLETRRLSAASSGFDIILGPRHNCNCQIRFERDNKLGIYFANTGYGLFTTTEPLPFDVTLDHEIALVHHRPSQTLLLFQNGQVVQTWRNLDFWAEFAYLGTWFKGQFASRVAIRRVTFLKEELKEN